MVWMWVSLVVHVSAAQIKIKHHRVHFILPALAVGVSSQSGTRQREVVCHFFLHRVVQRVCAQVVNLSNPPPPPAKAFQNQSVLSCNQSVCVLYVSTRLYSEEQLKHCTV